MWSPLVPSLMLSLGDFQDLTTSVFIAIEFSNKNHSQSSPSPPNITFHYSGGICEFLPDLIYLLLPVLICPSRKIHFKQTFCDFLLCGPMALSQHKYFNVCHMYAFLS